MKTHFKLIKGLTTACLLLIVFSPLRAQDLLTLKNGEEINVKVTEITDDDIKFKRTDNLEGPLRIYKKTEVFSIKYENGTKVVFNSEPVKTNTNNNTPVIVQLQEPVDKRFDNDSADFAKTKRKRFGGPRIGATLIGPGTAADYFSSQGKNPIITQFGWQFEGRLFTTGNGVQGLIEFVPLIGGIEQGLFVPSASLLLGIRSGGKNTFEFGIGPNFSVSKNYRRQSVGAVGVVIACGTSFKSDNIYFPVTIAFVPSVGSKAGSDYFDPDDTGNTEPLVKKGEKVQTGFKLSVLIGFNYRKK